MQLRPGEFPREVEWIDGELRFTHDLITGQRQVQFADVPSRQKAADTFRVIATSRQVPNEQRLDLGDTDVLISQQGLRFEPSRTLRHPRERRYREPAFGMRRSGGF